MEKPKRVQRSRKAGWRKPAGCIFVSRPNKYGNPYKIIGTRIYGDASHRLKGVEKYVFIEECTSDTVRPRAIELFTDWINGKNPYDIIPLPFTFQQALNELSGHDLGCWCSLHEACHADVWLRLVN